MDVFGGWFIIPVDYTNSVHSLLTSLINKVCPVENDSVLCEVFLVFSITDMINPCLQAFMH